MIKYLILFLSIQLSFLPIVYALPLSTLLNKGEKAPFNGILLNQESQAKILADKNEKEHLCELEKEYIGKKETENCSNDVQNLKIDLNAQTKKYDAVLSIKDNEINKLNKIVLKSDSNKAWWLAIGVTSGIIITVASFLLVSQVQKIAK